MSVRWGATPEEWAHFDLMLGVTADLLPVVSNPQAQISPQSRMKSLGKTPSTYNRQGFVAGLKDWTDRKTTPQQIEKWSPQSDYGICLKTGGENGIYALDIDLPDVQLSDKLAAAFLGCLPGVLLPERSRSNSGKTLLLFRLRGNYAKRSYRVEGGLVEFLGTGHQCVIAGTHPSGVRYAWGRRGAGRREFDRLPAEIPDLTDLFEQAWATTRDAFSLEPERRARDRKGTGTGEPVEDDTADWLRANWTTYGTEGGKLYVLCPWKDGHSGDSGETEAAWMLAGTGDYAQGHWVCLHASCSGRTDAEFFKAVGLKPAQASDFPRVALEAARADPVALYLEATKGLPGPVRGLSTGVKKTAAHPEGVVALPLPGFERKPNGDVLATIGNVAKAAASSATCGYRLRFDTFRSELVIADPNAENWRPIEDADAVEMRVTLASHRFEPVGKEMMRDAITLVARDQRFDTGINWLEEILPKWDGIERIETFYADYFNTEDSPYTRACGLYVWTAHAGRILDPGCQADMVPVLVGEQGLRKSTGVKAMSPSPEFFAKIDLGLKEADMSRSLRGVLVGELDELKGLAGRESEAIRAFVTKTHERWTPKYMEHDTTFARRLLFHGTSNNPHFLADPTGERRWLPMMVLGMVDTDRITADRDQLWAEARERYKRDGILWQEAERLARFEHAAFKEHDPWQGPVGRWLDQAETGGCAPRYNARGVTGEVVMVMALGMEPAKIQRRDQMRLAGVMKALDMVGDRRRQADGKPLRVWVDANSDLG
ncbi:VapE domain-containing protein [Phenylobacterium sp.]|uniref:VapE domain-containing protein n=1 Tax=Phenylobacterium sp. TaxID=1871053 RepID=UPI00374D518E